MDEQQRAIADRTMAQFGGLKQPTDTERLISRIDADIRKMQEFRAYVLGESAPSAAAVAEPKVRKKRTSKKGLPENKQETA